jgi:hypothetical protein
MYGSHHNEPTAAENKVSLERPLLPQMHQTHLYFCMSPIVGGAMVRVKKIVTWGVTSNSCATLPGFFRDRNVDTIRFDSSRETIF